MRRACSGVERLCQHQMMGRLDHCPPQVASSCLGDASSGALLTAVMDTGAESSIADQFLGTGEAGNATNGSEDRHHQQFADARQLDE